MQIKKEIIKSAKRTSNEKNGMHSWHPYYAGYSERFVSSAIEYLNLDNGIVLDPWAGSGTTNYVCEQYGLQSIGFDINPVMSHFTSAKQRMILFHLNQTKVKKLINEARFGLYKEKLSVELLDIVSKSLGKQLISLLHTILIIKLPDITITKELKTLSLDLEYENPLRSFLISCFFVTARSLAGYKCGSNPTWFKKIDKKPIYRDATIKKRYIECMVKMLSDLGAPQINLSKESLYFNCIGDAKDLPIEDSSIDAVITSPPYLTRIDYAVSTKLEILLLSGAEKLRNIREATMGAPIIKKQEIVINEKWGKKTIDLLSKVESHYSKSSRSYYLKNKKQYFDDAYRSLEEIYRVLKPGASALIVVQSSYYKEVEIPLGEIYKEMGINLGFEASIVNREVVKGHMAHVNIRSSEYKKDKVYYEDVIELKRSLCNKSISRILKNIAA